MYALTTDELLDFCSAETQRWRDWFKANAGTLDLPIDIAQAKTVRELVLHILAVELRYPERLLEETVTEYDQLPTATVDELFAAAERSANKLCDFMKSADEAEWKKIMTFPTRSAGTLSASKRKIFAHALLHGMRHWAQLATFLRQKGHKQPWPHDLIFSDVLS